MEKVKSFCLDWPFVTVILICLVPMLGLILTAPYFGPLPRLAIGGVMIWFIVKVLYSPFGINLHSRGRALYGPGAGPLPRLFMWAVVGLAVAGILLAVHFVYLIKIAIPTDAAAFMREQQAKSDAQAAAWPGRKEAILKTLKARETALGAAHAQQ